MLVKKMIEELQKCNPSNAVEVYFREDVYKIDSEYQLWAPKIVKDNGWDELITIELEKLMGY